MRGSLTPGASPGGARGGARSPAAPPVSRRAALPPPQPRHSPGPGSAEGTSPPRLPGTSRARSSPAASPPHLLGPPRPPTGGRAPSSSSTRRRRAGPCRHRPASPLGTGRRRRDFKKFPRPGQVPTLPPPPPAPAPAPRAGGGPAGASADPEPVAPCGSGLCRGVEPGTALPGRGLAAVARGLRGPLGPGRPPAPRPASLAVFQAPGVRFGEGRGTHRPRGAPGSPRRLNLRGLLR